MESLKLTGRSLHRKFDKRKGACINPLSRSRALKPRPVNQVEPDEVLQGVNIRLVQANAENLKKRSVKNKGVKKTFLYIKSQEQKSKKRGAKESEARRVESIRLKNAKDFDLQKEIRDQRESSKSQIMINLGPPEPKKQSKRVGWNASTNMHSKKRDFFVKNKRLQRLGSINEGRPNP